MNVGHSNSLLKHYCDHSLHEELLVRTVAQLIEARVFAVCTVFQVGYRKNKI